MPGDWGNLDCPHCGATHSPPEGAAVETEKLVADLVCPRCHNCDPLDASAVRVRFTAAVKKAKVRPVRFHDLRHTFGTRWRRPGCRCEPSKSGSGTASSPRP
jgi:integrase